VNAETQTSYVPTSVGHAFDRAAEAAGLTDVVFHTTRHTFASWCVQAGIPDRQIMAWIGHSSRHMLDRYAHLAPKAGVKVLEAIADARLTASADEGGTQVAQDVAAKKAAV
jgi:integrase